ncbi:Dihydroflavonol 4-reductase [Holothuria leucospilota]|uniref:Dihydroflavonol 4-reductase n=1 Tax=Holothuria leucospilota TaxID=206669 RepID=A0A9Q1BQR5_HOLLE|nr:Dihydroflavonol 4-reductase [Holothuria leucospilota]
MGLLFSSVLSSSGVLVTGASGYVASSTVNRLLADGYNVRGTVRSLRNTQKITPLTSLAHGKRGTLELVEADLLTPETWKSAVEGCSHVLHIASPFPVNQPKDADEVIRPAVEGTLNVLKACKEAGSVKRVTLTSSIASVGMYNTTRPLTEDDWTDPGRGGAEDSPYIISKVMAEKEAFKYVSGLADKDKFEICSLLPGFIVGPVITNQAATSLEFIKRIMVGGDPLVPLIGFSFVDIRDVVEAQIVSLTSPKVPGNRFIITDKFMQYHKICEMLNDEFRHQGYSPSSRLAPRFLIRLMSLFDEMAESMNVMWGIVTEFDNSKMRNVLGITPRDSRKAVIDMAYSLIDNGYIKKSKLYGQKANQIYTLDRTSPRPLYTGSVARE